MPLPPLEIGPVIFLCERKYHQRLQKGRPPFVGRIICDPKNDLKSIFDTINVAKQLSKDIRFQTLFCKGFHWSMCDFFSKKKKPVRFYTVFLSILF